MTTSERALAEDEMESKLRRMVDHVCVNDRLGFHTVGTLAIFKTLEVLDSLPMKYRQRFAEMLHAEGCLK